MYTQKMSALQPFTLEHKNELNICCTTLSNTLFYTLHTQDSAILYTNDNGTNDIEMQTMV